MKFWPSVVIVGLTMLSACGGEELSQSQADMAEPSTENLAQTSNGLVVDGNDHYVMEYHGGSGGSFHTAYCPPGYVAVSIKGRAGQHIDRISLTCHKLLPDGGIGSEWETTAWQGGAGGTDFRMDCPLGQAIVEVYGASGWYVDRLGIACATPMGWLNTFNEESYPAAVGGTGGSFFFDRCNQGYVLTGLNLRTGELVDGVQGRCSKLN